MKTNASLQINIRKGIGVRGICVQLEEQKVKESSIFFLFSFAWRLFLELQWEWLNEKELRSVRRYKDGLPSFQRCYSKLQWNRDGETQKSNYLDGEIVQPEA